VRLETDRWPRSRIIKSKCINICIQQNKWYITYNKTCDCVIFFFYSRKPYPQKSYFVGPSKRVKPRLSQALTRDARPDSNSRPTVQISSPLPLRYVHWRPSERVIPSSLALIPRHLITTWNFIYIYIYIYNHLKSII